MDVDRLTAGLATHRMGRPVVYADAVDSTNARAAAALAGGALPEGTAFVASRQTRGRGTGERRWLSGDDEGLCLSLVIQEPIAHQPLSFLPAIALVDVLQEQFAIDAHLVWPNDVYVEDRKLSGILVESQLQPDRRTAWVVGIGVNVNQTAFPAEIATKAVSLRLVTGGAGHSREELYQALMERLESIYDGDVGLVSLWCQRSRMLGRRLWARRPGGEDLVAATATGLSPAGHLQVVLDDTGQREEWVARVDIERIERRDG